jgi:hypothetical protein
MFQRVSPSSERKASRPVGPSPRSCSAESGRADTYTLVGPASEIDR